MYENILDEHAPVRLKKCNNATGKSKFITPEIRKAMWKRNMRKRKYYKTKSSADWEAYRIIRNRVVTMRRKSIKNHFEQLCYSRAGIPRDFWNALRPLMHTKKGPPEQSITLRENREVIRDQKQVAETLNDYFTNITRDLVVEKHSALKDQSHTSRMPRINRESNDNFLHLVSQISMLLGMYLIT